MVDCATYTSICFKGPNRIRENWFFHTCTCLIIPIHVHIHIDVPYCSLLFPVDSPKCWRSPLPKHITQPTIFETRRLLASNISRQQCAPVDAWQIIPTVNPRVLEYTAVEIVKPSPENHEKSDHHACICMRTCMCVYIYIYIYVYTVCIFIYTYTHGIWLSTESNSSTNEGLTW